MTQRCRSTFRARLQVGGSARPVGSDEVAGVLHRDVGGGEVDVVPRHVCRISALDLQAGQLSGRGAAPQLRAFRTGRSHAFRVAPPGKKPISWLLSLRVF